MLAAFPVCLLGLEVVTAAEDMALQCVLAGMAAGETVRGWRGWREVAALLVGVVGGVVGLGRSVSRHTRITAGTVMTPSPSVSTTGRV
jgi:hypothetical protein